MNCEVDSLRSELQNKEKYWHEQEVKIRAEIVGDYENAIQERQKTFARRIQQREEKVRLEMDYEVCTLYLRHSHFFCQFN